MKKILLVDDHAVVRQGLKQILSEELNGIQFGEASQGSEALDPIEGEFVSIRGLARLPGGEYEISWESEPG